MADYSDSLLRSVLLNVLLLLLVVLLNLLPLLLLSELSLMLLLSVLSLLRLNHIGSEYHAAIWCFGIFKRLTLALHHLLSLVELSLLTLSLLTLQGQQPQPVKQLDN